MLGTNVVIYISGYIYYYRY